jgi:hypothetical protein
LKVLSQHSAIGTYYARVSVRAVRCRSLTAAVRGGQSWLTSCEICGDGNDTEGLLRASSVSSLSITPSLLRQHLPPPPEVCESPDQAAYCNILSLTLWASSLPSKLFGYKVRKVIFLCTMDFSRKAIQVYLRRAQTARI